MTGDRLGGFRELGESQTETFPSLPLMIEPPSCPRLARGTLYKSVYILLSLCRGLSGSCCCRLRFLSYCPAPSVSSSSAACYSINSRSPSNPDLLPGRPGVSLLSPWPAGEPGSWGLDPNLWFCLLSLCYLIFRMGTVGLEDGSRMTMEEGRTELSLFHEAPAFCDTLLLATHSPLPYYTGPRASSYSSNTCIQ
jgi:hypothetical protein